MKTITGHSLRLLLPLLAAGLALACGGRGTRRDTGGGTVVVAARITVRPDSVQAFINLCKPLIEETRREEGCLRYELYQDPERPEIFFFYEEYADAAAKEYHGRQEYMVQYRLRRGPMLAAEPATEVYEVRPAQ